MNWSEMERRQPRLAELGRQRLIEPGVLLAGTIRRDGTPRISPVEFHLFAVGFEQASYIRYDDASGDQFVAQWPPAREFVRRATSPTSVGEPEPRTDLLLPDPA